MSLQVPTQVKVLVVGAGPVGLVSAIALTQLGVEVAIVDAAFTNQNGSRANVVHSHTLEVLDSIGLAEPLIQAGLRTDAIVFNGKTNKLLEIDLNQLRDVTKFPFSVIIPQHEVERIFRERLASDGIHIFRNKSVVGFRQADSGVEVSFEDGSVTRTQYIVGADGSHSTIRRLSGIEFKDPYTGVSYDDKVVPPSLHLVLADIHLQEPLPASIPRDRMSMHLDNLLLLIPLQPLNTNLTSDAHKTSSWRIGFGIPIGHTDAPHTRTLEYMQQQLDERNPWGTGAGVTISSIEASSRYRVRAAVASSYFHKVGNANILLAGDAAHVHAPVGGQGMNLGICDAVAAAHAIQSHRDSRVKDGDSDSDVVLMQYADLRRNIGVRVVGMTSGLTSVINAGVGWRRPIRNVVMAIINRLPFFQMYAAMRISGLANRMT
ncbi:FAD/NAD(P)-binding domain-containing protein [Ramaria rubella]|nr:FAD/NAD(P)-binding domain-containing protein [Ramaria rubella]